MSQDRGITRLSIGFNKTAAVTKVAPLYGSWVFWVSNTLLLTEKVAIWWVFKS